MSDKSAIEWTSASWNPIRGTTGRHVCQRVSPGCTPCYAASMTKRFSGIDYAQPGESLRDTPRLDIKAMDEPSRWKEPRRIFVCSMTDLFGEWMTFYWIDQIMAVMLVNERHTFQVLTKRPSRMLEWRKNTRLSPLADDPDACLSNVQFGVSIELAQFNWRADRLREMPAAVRWISAEPLMDGLEGLDLTGIDWLVAGGQSGGDKSTRLVEPCTAIQADMGDGYWHRSRDMKHGTACECGGTRLQPTYEALTWVRGLRDRCAASGTAFFFKAWGGQTFKSAGRELDGRTWDEFPESKALVPA